MRKSISVTFFSVVATLLVLGTAVMGCSEWVLFNRYFAQERYEALDSVAEVTQRAADYVVQQAALGRGTGRAEHQAGDHRRERRSLSVPDR